MDKIRVTLGTNILPTADLESAATAANIELAIASVTEREVESTSFANSLDPLSRVLETAVWDESPFDGSVFAGEKEVDCFETLLRLISSGSFPKPAARGQLTARQHKQLRDAMIFCAHAREKRDIFVTQDAKGFISGERKMRLESLFHTRIMTRKEFEEHLTSAAAI